MSSSDGNSTTRPLRKRKSKRFDRSGGAPRVAGSAVIDGVDTSAQDPEAIPQADTVPVADTPDAEFIVDSVVDRAPAAPESLVHAGSTATAGESDLIDRGPAPIGAEGNAATDVGQPLLADSSGRHPTLDELAVCGRCGHEVSTINIEVDGNVLVMESCDNCDTRRWQLAGEAIELQQALDHVGEHAGRRR